MFGHGQGQYQGQRPAKSAPYECELIIKVDALGEAHAFKGRHEHEQPKLWPRTRQR
jgi:hypothetical protein